MNEVEWKCSWSGGDAEMYSEPAGGCGGGGDDGPSRASLEKAASEDVSFTLRVQRRPGSVTRLKPLSCFCSCLCLGARWGPFLLGSPGLPSFLIF